LGKGYALRAGFAQAKGDIIITIDSDGSHRPEELLRVLTPVLKDKADLVIGSRYLNQKNVAARKLNAFGVRIFNLLIQLLTGTVITDSQSGYRAMKREVLNNQKLNSGGYEIESEMLVKPPKKASESLRCQLVLSNALMVAQVLTLYLTAQRFCYRLFWHT